MSGGISGLYVGTYDANEYRKTCGEECKDCPYYENGKCHQNVLVFFKGDPKTIKNNYQEVEVAELPDAPEEESRADEGLFE